MTGATPPLDFNSSKNQPVAGVTVEALLDALDGAGFPRIGHGSGHVRYGHPDEPARHFVNVPIDPTAPEYPEYLRATLETIRRSAALGAQAGLALAALATPAPADAPQYALNSSDGLQAALSAAARAVVTDVLQRLLDADALDRWEIANHLYEAANKHNAVATAARLEHTSEADEVEQVVALAAGMAQALLQLLPALSRPQRATMTG